MPKQLSISSTAKGAVASFNQHIFGCDALGSLNITVSGLPLLSPSMTGVHQCKTVAAEIISLVLRDWKKPRLASSVFYPKECKEKHTTEQQYGPRYARYFHFFSFFFCGCIMQWHPKPTTRSESKNNWSAGVFASVFMALNGCLISSNQSNGSHGVPFEAEWGSHWHHVYILNH